MVSVLNVIQSPQFGFAHIVVINVLCMASAQIAVGGQPKASPKFLQVGNVLAAVIIMGRISTLVFANQVLTYRPLSHTADLLKLKERNRLELNGRQVPLGGARQMRVFNTGAIDFWSSIIGEQLRLLKLINLQYCLTSRSVRDLIEKVAKNALPKCRRFGKWPILDMRKGAITFTWRNRGEVVISTNGSKISYTPDPIRRSNTINMILDLTLATQSGSIEKFINGCLWHILEIYP